MESTARDAGIDLVGRVESSALDSQPFDHVYMEDLFAPAYYRRLLDLLPATRRYRELRHRQALRPDGQSARRKFYLFPEHIMFLPAGQRERRFGRSTDTLSFYPVLMLLRDLGRYRIGIHGDSMRKAITVQFYLPRDDRQAHLGTLFHEGRNGEAAQRSKALAFRPATGYAFPVMRHQSWHSVAQMTEADGERNSLMLTYYVQQGALDWLAQRLRRLLVSIAYGLRE